MASIKPYEKDGRTFYRVAVYVGRDELSGKPRYIKKSSFESKAEAKLWAARTTLDAQGGGLVNYRSMTYREVYNEWSASYKHTIRPSSWKSMRGVFENHVLAVLGGVKIQRITTSLLQKAVNKWSESGMQSFPEWYRRALMVIKYARQRRYMTHDTALGVIIPKRIAVDDDATENFWDKKELEHFFSLVDPVRQARYYTLFRLLAFSGMRRGEAMVLTWADLDFNKSCVNITKTMSIEDNGKLTVQPPKTAAGRRVVSLDPETMAILRRWRLNQIKLLLAKGINANTPGQLIFPSRDNRLVDPSVVGNWLSNFQEKHGIEHRITPHGFRHSHATALLDAGVNIKVVQKRLGHENVQTTLAIYTHASEGQQEQAAQQVANYLNF